MKIGIIGAGNTGMACAVHLVSAGYEPILYSRSERKAATLRRGTAVSGAISGDFTLTATTDLVDVLRQVSVVIICTWANAHSAVFANIKDALELVARDTATSRSSLDIIIFNGNWGAYEAYSQLGGNPGVDCIAETSGMPYVATADFGCPNAEEPQSSAKLDFPAIKTEITASFSKPGSVARQLLEDLYDDVEIADSLFETSLMAPNPIIHAPLCLLNMTKIEAGMQFSMLTDGFTGRAENIVAHIDDERAALASALGCDYEPILAQLNGQWGSDYPTLTQLFRQNPVYSSLQGPTDTNHRFIQEDIPYGIAPLVSLGTLLGVETPACSALLSVYSLYFKRDYSGPHFQQSVIERLRRRIES